MAAHARSRWVVATELLGLILLAIPLAAYRTAQGQALRGLGAGGDMVIFGAILHFSTHLRDRIAQRRVMPVWLFTWLTAALPAALLIILCGLYAQPLLRERQPVLAALEGAGGAAIVGYVWIAVRTRLRK
jgi:hypothetical protein